MQNSYKKEISAYFVEKSNSFEKRPYLETTQQGKMTEFHRTVVLDWLVKTSGDLKASDKTLELSILYLECFLSKKPVSSLPILELVAVLCFCIALKYEEGRPLTPSEIQEVCSVPVALNDILTTEFFIIRTLEWNLDIPTVSEVLYSLLPFTPSSGNFTKYILPCYLNYSIAQRGVLAMTLVAGARIFNDLDKAVTEIDWFNNLQQELKLSLDSFKNII